MNNITIKDFCDLVSYHSDITCISIEDEMGAILETISTPIKSVIYDFASIIPKDYHNNTIQRIFIDGHGGIIVITIK